MNITESEVTPPKNELVTELEKLSDSTKQAIAELKTEVADNKIDYVQFTDKLSVIFENSLERLEKIDNSPDFKALTQPIAEAIASLKTEIANVKQAVNNIEVKPEVDVAPPDLSGIETAINGLSLNDIDIVTPEDVKKALTNIQEILEEIKAQGMVSGGTTIMGGGSGLTDEQLRATPVSVDLSETELPLPASQISDLKSVAVTNLPVTQPVSGTITANKGTGFVDPQTDALTDTELRATAVPVAVEESIYKKLIDDTTTTDVTYIGEADLGTATSASSWRIKKIDTSSGTAITWSGTGFNVAWDDRVSVTYT